MFVSHDYYLGGAGKSLLLLIKNLKAFYPIATCIQYGRFIEECQKAGIETEVFLRKHIHTSNTLRERVLHLWEDLRCFIKCWQFVKKKKINLIHINSAMTFLVVFGLVGKLRGIPVVWHLRDIPPPYWVQRLVNFMVARFSSAIVCISSTVRDRFLSTTRVTCPVEVISNPLDTNELPVLPNIIRENVVFGMVGQIVGWKRYDLFLAAALQVFQSHRDVRFLIIGKPGRGFEHLLEDLREFVKTNKLEGIVEFDDWKTDMADIYGRINVIVNASKEEPWGRTLVEGMALGRPAIAFRSGGPVDIIENYVDGILVDEDSAEELARAMLYFLDEPRRILEMGKSARENVIRRFGVKKHIERVQKVFMNLLRIKES
ncbi:glycosyltransferase family 4 protein [Candidatus Sumerlaeota bacterium]|nr:glycosyltransferase family 4 protein [Candidatus Sumerlaeota bacterium]